jgi:hypothetical protein
MRDSRFEIRDSRFEIREQMRDSRGWILGAGFWGLDSRAERLERMLILMLEGYPSPPPRDFLSIEKKGVAGGMPLQVFILDTLRAKY